ncbi:unnamed protein product [Musa textilis]
MYNWVRIGPTQLGANRTQIKVVLGRMEGPNSDLEPRQVVVPAGLAMESPEGSVFQVESRRLYYRTGRWYRPVSKCTGRWYRHGWQWNSLKARSPRLSLGGCIAGLGGGTAQCQSVLGDGTTQHRWWYCQHS